MTDTWTPLVRSQEPFSDALTHDPNGWVRLAAMERLGASVAELALDQMQSILGETMPVEKEHPLSDTESEPKGHKPARPDIQKMKDVYDLYQRTQVQHTPSGNPSREYNDWQDSEEAQAAIKEWESKYGLDDTEKKLLRMYRACLNQVVNGPNNEALDEPYTPQWAFEATCVFYDQLVAQSKGEEIDPNNPPPPSPESKKIVGATLKKADEQASAKLYPAIKKNLYELFRISPGSFKLWPWFVKQMKAEFQKNSILHPGDPIGQTANFNHERDIVREAGEILAKLKQDNKMPQNFDINKMDLKDLESWLMEWKRNNRVSESTGEVVYQFHDGWTVQKLTTDAALQYEGDEMGHCVGGYGNAVDSGRTGIYSLRDPKGEPHVTMELENPLAYKRMSDKPYSQLEPQEYLDMDKAAGEMLDHRGQPAGHQPIPDLANAEESAHWQNLRYENRDQADKLYPGIPHSPAYVHPESDHDNFYESNGLPWAKEFGVVQIMGKSNKTPKPEYQRKMKEFLDAYRAKGMTFNKADNFYGAWDDPYGDDSNDNDPSNYQELQDWYEAYQGAPHEWRDPKEDAYGLPADRKTISGGYIDEVIENTVYGLVNDYDRSSDKPSVHNWQEAAQQIYHLMNVQYLQERVDTPERKEAEKKNWIEEIDKAQQKVDDWSMQMQDNNWEYNRERIQEKFGEMAPTNNINIDNYVDEETGHYDWDQIEQEHEDEWREAQDEVHQEDEREMFGDCYYFLNYLYQLVEKNGHVGPKDMPDPNQNNSGLPSYEEIQERPWSKDEWNQKIEIPGTLSKVHNDKWVEHVAASPYEIVPIDETNNAWLDEDGQLHQRYRPGWAKDETGKMKQTGEMEDTFLDKQGRQGQGVVAYHGGKPVGSLTWVEDPNGWNMIGTTYVHPEHREQGLFNQMAEPLKASGKPTDAYVWNNPWLKNKVRSWATN